MLVSLKSKAGRNNNGRIMVRHQGEWAQTSLPFDRLQTRDKDDVEAVVKTIEYDPNRSANIALVHYTDGVKAYIIAQKGLEVGQRMFQVKQISKSETLFHLLTSQLVL